MNNLTQRYRTHKELLSELRARLGYIAQGPSANNNRALMKSFLREAHNYVYDQLSPAPMRKKTVIALEPGSYLYDWHNDEEDEDIDPALVKSVWVINGSDRYPLIQGITERHREDETRSQPTRYDTLNGQIELWPIPDKTGYGLSVEYIAGKPRFSESSDRPGVPDDLVLLYAIYAAKAHLRHPDYQVASSAFTAALSKAKSRQHENRRYFVTRPYYPEGEVIGEKGTYRFVVR